MNTIITKRFEEMGARVKIRTTPDRFRRFSIPNEQRNKGIPRLDVRTDKHGEYFDISFPAGVEPAQIDVVNIKPKERHLLLQVKDDDGKGHISKSKFLCGHDERHWFVAAIPEVGGIGDVNRAKEALQPRDVRQLLAQSGLKPNEKLKRKNEIYRRQGEWFFVPQKQFTVEKDRILRNEPLTRGRGSKPHNMEFCYRTGGTTVYVNRQHPTGITQEAYNKLSPDQRKAGWQVMVRDAGVYAKGRISHADHATIFLPVWCRVMMNTENEAAAMRHVAFLD